MKFVEYPIGNSANASAYEGAGILRCFRSPLLSDIVEAIWDCDIPDADFAKALTIKCAPGTSLQLIGQYRTPAEIHQRTEILPTKCATHIQSHAVTLRPTGALGVIIVCLRSHAASRIVHAPLREFANANLHLGDLFSACEVAMCDDMLAAAQTSDERISGVQSFLLRHLRPHTDEPRQLRGAASEERPNHAGALPRCTTGLQPTSSFACLQCCFWHRSEAICAPGALSKNPRGTTDRPVMGAGRPSLWLDRSSSPRQRIPGHRWRVAERFLHSRASHWRSRDGRSQPHSPARPSNGSFRRA